jgi:hypothetical protein
MAITYTWKVTSLKTKTEGANQDAVVQTYWQKTGTDESGNTGTFSGATPFTSTTMTNGNTFIPFSQLTEEIVLTWIKGIVIDGYEEHVNNKIKQQIDQKLSPVNETQMPWAPPTPPAPTTDIP